MNKYILNGKNIKDLDSLYAEFARAVKAPKGYFGKCMQSFDDCLFGGFGLEAPCEIIWEHSENSKELLDSDKLIEYCEDIASFNPYIYEPSHEQAAKWLEETLSSAKEKHKCLFDEIVETIESVPSRASWNHEIKLLLQ